MTTHNYDHCNGEVAVVVVPLPAQGHLNQLLQLSRLVTTYGIPVHYVGFTNHNRQAKARVHGWDPQNSSLIRFHDFQLSSNLVNALSTSTDDVHSTSKFPAHLQPVFEAAGYLQQPVSTLLWALAEEFKRVVVVHDSLMGSVIQDVRLISNAESYTFHTVSAFALFFYIWELAGKPLQLDDDDVPKEIPPNEGCFTSDFSDFMAKQYTYLSLSSGRLYNTSRSIEDKYMDLLQKLPMNLNKKLYAVGPLNPVIVTGKRKHRCLDWLDKQPVNSVLYVSFGTTTSFSGEQIKELAKGLEQSEVRFIWVFRDADKTPGVEEGRRIDDVAPAFEERVKDRGMVVRDWAPQLEILGHSSTGGFLSHCGWNSCMESVSMGVPMAAWPIHSDQPKNTVLVTQVLRVGIAVKDWECREKVVTASAVENAVRRLMASDEMRRRAHELAGRVQGSVAPGGVSHLEMDSFIAHITR
uniref:Glycosyltransferase n=1 Tax=Fagopyrum tataricum TaxID=62330 RepID=A0A6B7ENS3_FAGTA|nr:UGT93R1 [Fagopyrum tataricum]